VLPDVDAPPADEELTSGGSGWPRLGLGVLVVSLVVGLLAVRLAERPGPSPRRTAQHHFTQLRNHPVPLDAQRDCPAAGDGQTICTTSPHVPAAVFAAVRARFPHAHRVAAVEERLRDVGFGPGGVWYRALRVAVGRQSIVVVVRRRTADDRPPYERRAGTGEIRVTRLVGERAVVVAVTGPAGRLPAIEVVRALADDRRLLTGSNT
jgi:hypothetical protein